MNAELPERNREPISACGAMFFASASTSFSERNKASAPRSTENVNTYSGLLSFAFRIRRRTAAVD